MKKLALVALLLNSVVAHSLVINVGMSRSDKTLTNDLIYSCTHFFAPPRESTIGEYLEAEDNCILFVTTTSLPTLIIETPGVTINDPETINALINGDRGVAQMVALHFDVTADKILNTVSAMDEAELEITMESIGAKLK